MDLVSDSRRLSVLLSSQRRVKLGLWAQAMGRQHREVLGTATTSVPRGLERDEPEVVIARRLGVTVSRSGPGICGGIHRQLGALCS